ncbi:MAG: cell envelope integrity protein CreD [Myxococcota bacterium]|nr:cell envelope integrity protein CreD [Myxococcota bacterium]
MHSLKQFHTPKDTNQFLRVLLIGFIILLLQIPIGLLHGVIFERQQSRDEAVEDVTSKWGESQSLIGPVLVVPFKRMLKERRENDKTVLVEATDHAIFLPETLTVTTDVRSEVRYRGIYDVPVYRADVNLTGTFGALDFSDWDVKNHHIMWDKARLSIRISDVQALVDSSDLQWGDTALELEPGSHHLGNPGVHAKVQQALLTNDEIPFTLTLTLNGSEHFSVAPIGSQTEFSLTSNWPDPSFQGKWLPRDKVTPTSTGFDAHWSVNLLGRNYPHKWAGQSTHEQSMSESLLQVTFLPPVDQYRMAFRSVKYEVLFLVMVFITLWLFEVLSGIQIHAIQYIMVGVAMCLFYLLELSLAEHLGFGPAYAIAALMVSLLVSGYCRAVLKTRARAALVGTVLTLLYGFLYMLLVNQGYALLAGSLGLFGTLAVVMYLTRNVEWNTVGEHPAPHASP